VAACQGSAHGGNVSGRGAARKLAGETQIMREALLGESLPGEYKRQHAL
jgi:hypothetical protein